MDKGIPLLLAAAVTVAVHGCGGPREEFASEAAFSVSREVGPMVAITFPDRATEKRALAFLIGRYSGWVLCTGEHLVPEAALEALADQNIPFTVKGMTTHKYQVAASLEVLLGLPLQFKDGREVPPDWLPEAVLEVVDHFGAANYDTQNGDPDNRWVKVVVYVPDSAKILQWRNKFEAHWRPRCQQLGNWGLSSHVNWVH
jgi:hypothetical protein